MKIIFLMLTFLATLLPCAATGQDLIFKGKPSEFEDYGYLVRGAIWQFEASQEKVIFVCWENPTAANDIARRWVQDQIQKTWQKHTELRFRGWSKCGENNSGIRIAWNDEGPHVKEFGRLIDNVKAGMVLNHEFNNWSRSCKSKIESCVRSISVHEFGHALGFAHEQNRPDTPGECSREHGQGQNKEIILTPYDAGSVMNYCNDVYNNNGELSALDVSAAQKLYGRPSK